MQILREDIAMLELLFGSCDIDYNIISGTDINFIFFKDYANQRVVNSFLFNYIKIQDKMGGKLFKNLLYELKEITDFSVPMIDVLNNLEKLNIIERADVWDRLREIRNTITHEYPSDIDERIENIKLALEGYITLKQIFAGIKKYCTEKRIF